MKWAVVVMILALAGGVAAYMTVRPNLPAAERGRRLAERMGCFGCHGPGGIRGAANPGRTDETVPGFEGDVMMFAKSPDEIRQWITTGTTEKRKVSETWQAERKAGALKMPAFGRRLERRQIDDLVAFVRASAGEPEPEDSLAAAGLTRADSLGCTGCHGAGGRFARNNPRSLKGYLPSWDGADFPDLVKSREEFGEWVEDGVSKRFKSNPAASFYLRRAVLHMPAFRTHLLPGDVDALWAYVEWLRSPETQQELKR
ncbi:MAG TPA: c-type cytochrome [Candidatus Eisenbacteria bacterium]|nr:c-type cytochrome [Candidatus Eisenbacteria bacterium]